MRGPIQPARPRSSHAELGSNAGAATITTPTADQQQQQHRDLALYTGVSNRSRGWKSRKNTEAMEGRVPHHSNIKRWDGAAKMSYSWDNLRRVGLRGGMPFFCFYCILFHSVLSHRFKAFKNFLFGQFVARGLKGKGSFVCVLSFSDYCSASDKLPGLQSAGCKHGVEL